MQPKLYNDLFLQIGGMCTGLHVADDLKLLKDMHLTDPKASEYNSAICFKNCRELHIHLPNRMLNSARMLC